MTIRGLGWVRRLSRFGPPDSVSSGDAPFGGARLTGPRQESIEGSGTTTRPRGTAAAPANTPARPSARKTVAGALVGLLLASVPVWADFFGPSAGAGKAVTVNRVTQLVLPGQSAVMNIVTGVNFVTPSSLAVYSGCKSYDFGLYASSAYQQGDELLYVAGQEFNYYDGDPPRLRDADSLKQIHVRFVNRGVMGCEFNLVVKGSGS